MVKLVEAYEENLVKILLCLQTVVPYGLEVVAKIAAHCTLPIFDKLFLPLYVTFIDLLELIMLFQQRLCQSPSFMVLCLFGIRLRLLCCKVSRAQNIRTFARRACWYVEYGHHWRNKCAPVAIEHRSVVSITLALATQH